MLTQVSLLGKKVNESTQTYEPMDPTNVLSLRGHVLEIGLPAQLMLLINRRVANHNN